jgi:hypothetical protein
MFNDISKIKRVNIYMPKFLINKYYEKLIKEWNVINNSDKLEKELNDNKHKLKLLTQINVIYPIMLKMLDLTAKYGLKSSRDLLTKLYIDIYKREPKTAEDYEKIYKDVNIKILKYKQRYSDDDNKKKNNVDFEQLIINLEIILAPVTLRDKKLYTLPKYIELASKKIKQNTGHGRNK